MAESAAADLTNEVSNKMEAGAESVFDGLFVKSAGAVFMNEGVFVKSAGAVLTDDR
jgi:hypothetical protein